MPCDDGIEYEIHITHKYELLPELMYWQPHVAILEEEGDLQIIEAYTVILKESLEQQSQESFDKGYT